ncbi:AfsR/SARP family transcriptional regulator [Yinghuangia sp. YIM S09857]|uniref:AfsR/SARP family transcriptional regulator n=1 Tax=Yinghuangia sp. YIM S09857 TaxID=3436929 RepID=UPI003F530D57
MYVSVLGPLQVRDDQGDPVAVSGARLRVLLTRLALDPGRPVPSDSLVRAVWDRAEPSGAANALQSLVSRLRRMLGPEAITSGPAGYVLALAPDAVDAHRFEQAASEGRRLLATGDAAGAERVLTGALDLWRGAALADAAESGFAAGPAARLEEQRLTAVEDRVDARLRLGRAAEVVPELEQLATEHPLRERLHGQLMTALDAVGRRADALSVYHKLRTELGEALGIDPSPELDAVHIAVLRGERGVGIGTAASDPAPGSGSVSGPGPGPGPGSVSGPASVSGSASVPDRDSGSVSGPVATTAPFGRAPAPTQAGPSQTGPGQAGPSPTLAAGAGVGEGALAGGVDSRGGASGSTASDDAGSANSGGTSTATPNSALSGGTSSSAASAASAGSGVNGQLGSDARGSVSSPSQAPPTNLTARLTSFVGRDDERLRLGQLLHESRLVSVVGPGGAGKTRITVETGSRLLPEFPAGVWFVELAPVHDPADIPQAILGALGRRDFGIINSMADTSGSIPAGDALARVVEVLARRPALLILDNCEHLVAGAAEVADILLAEAPALRILTSTREPLGIVGETLYPLGPLTLPDDHGDTTTALRSAAVRLFADRAKAVRPNLVVDDANVAAVAEICRRLDGMPLAIELAAARTRSLTPTQIARRLDDRFRLLTGGSRTAMPRHQTLRAVVEWSWDLLDDPERALLRRLSVFAGGATLEAAETVLADGALVHRDDVLDLLAGLVDKSLVEMFGTGEPRYRMLETIAAFAAEHRDDAGADAGVTLRHVAWCKAVLERADPMLRTAEQLEAIDTIIEEHDNIAAALRFAIDAGDAESAVRLVALMAWYWTIRGYHREATAWLGDALGMPGADDIQDRESHILAAWFYGTTLVVTTSEMQGLRWMMRSRWHLRHFTPSPDHPVFVLIEAMNLAFQDYTSGTGRALEGIDEHRDPWVRGVIDLMRGHISINTGRTDEGLDCLRRARLRFVELGDRWGRSSAVAGLSEVYRYTGRFAEGLAAIDECLELVGQLRSDEDVPFLYLRRGMMHLQLGDIDAARRDLAASVETAHSGDTVGGLLIGYAGSGDLARLLGDREEADRQYALALAELPRARVVPAQMLAMLQLSVAYHYGTQGDRGKARLALDASRVAAVDSHDMPVMASTTEGMAWWTLESGDAEQAAVLLGAAVAMRGHEDLGSLDTLATTERVRAALAPEVYEEAYARGAALSQEDAAELLARS